MLLLTRGTMAREEGRQEGVLRQRGWY